MHSSEAEHCPKPYNLPTNEKKSPILHLPNIESLKESEAVDAIKI